MNNERNSIVLEDFSLFCIARMIWRNLWMVVACAALFAMSVSLYCDYGYQPLYQSNMTYAVTARETSFTTNRNNSVSQEVIAVLTELIGTNVLQEDIRQYAPELTNFNGSIQASRVAESNLITVSATASTPEMAFRALDALVAVFPELSHYISDNAVLQVLQNPTVSSRPVNQINARRMILCAAAAGAAAMMVLLVWFCISAETVQTKAGAKRLLDASIIATIGHEKKNRTLRAKLRKTNKGLQVFAPSTSFAYAEQINTICSRLEHEADVNNHKIFMITGVGENEGKSTVAGNVAAMLAMKGKRVALVDGDLRKPALHRFFDGTYESAMPLNLLLELPYSRENVSECIVRHPRLGLYMLFSSSKKTGNGDLLTGPTMKLLLQQLRVFDYVIIDTPPMGFFADTEALAALVDASMLVVRQDYTPACDINDAADALRDASGKFLGCILNDMRGHSIGSYGYGYGYGYGRGYGYGKKMTKTSKSSGEQS